MTIAAHPKEITVRGVLLGIVITLIFTAAQVYLGLKVGLTFATSIPAAVISMALLRVLTKDSTIQENNVVQTIASAAGTLASVIFVLPGLIMIGWWDHVPFWTTFAACALGGVLGVMYTMPLRRALVTHSDLPYPEGVAAAEVLKVGMSSREGEAEGSAGLWAVVWGSLASALYIGGATSGIMAGEVSTFFKFGKGSGATGLGGSSSLALIGAGHLMGITVGVAMLIGLIIAWGIGVPILTVRHPMPELSVIDHATFIWKHQVRFIGAGAIGAAAIWTLSKLIVPVWGGLVSALESAKAAKVEGAVLPRSEHDLPVWIVGLVVVISMVPVGWLLAAFLGGTALSSIAVPLVIAGTLYVLIAGLLAAAVCGYMAGLIGSSNSPVSGIAILTVLGAAVIIGVIGHSLTGPDASKALIAFALMVTTVVLAVAVIGNDNLQDLKTGQLVDATPWKQQVGLLIGVLAGSVVVPLTLNLLNNVWGFAGDPHYHALDVHAGPMSAPQATLISTLAKGAIGGDLPLGYLGIGALVGVALIIIDASLKAVSKGRLSLPPLGVGLAIYLPSAVSSPVVIGAVIGWIYDRYVGRHKSYGEVAKRLGVLLASGFIVGESLFSVFLAAGISITQNADIITFKPAPPAIVATLLALIVAAVVVGGLYWWAGRAAKKAVTET